MSDVLWIKTDHNDEEEYMTAPNLYPWYHLCNIKESENGETEYGIDAEFHPFYDCIIYTELVDQQFVDLAASLSHFVGIFTVFIINTSTWQPKQIQSTCELVGSAATSS